MNDTYTKLMLDSSHISGSSAEYVDNLYELYLSGDTSIPVEWQNFFANLDQKNTHTTDVSHAEIRSYFKQNRKRRLTSTSDVPVSDKQANVISLINAYRVHGHHHADLDPLKLSEHDTANIYVKRKVPDLDISFHKLSSSDLSTSFQTMSPLLGGKGSLADILASLKKAYCASVGIEYMHITDNTEVSWFQERIETNAGTFELPIETKQRILRDLTAAEGLERYLGNRYVGQKRFSLEGGDSLIPLMNTLVEKAGAFEVKELIIGMAHRGRLNVLINVLGKKSSELYQEFEGKVHGDNSGDVKYHLGFSSDVKTQSGNIVHLALAFNPSHLEIISPVVQGSVRARLRRRNDLTEKRQVVPIVIHGDAAFAGQGVVMETFNFSQARGYSTGGTVHIVINNQIGFTTSNPIDSRSTFYCTDIAKMIQAPILHVNADDPEAVVRMAELAFDYRMKFKKDIVIDLVCYRRHGHNEADDPSLTQPFMYKRIRAHESVRIKYANQLIKNIPELDSEALFESYRDKFDKGEATIKTENIRESDAFAADWSQFKINDWRAPYDSTVSYDRIKRLWEKLSLIPKGFLIHKSVQRLMDERTKMTQGEMLLNWGYAETMAYASLIDDGFAIRLSGQDSGRGTFSHRHAVLHDVETGQNYVPLSAISNKEQQAVIIDSVLSEEAVLGFEFGFATADPSVCVIWEAQFGDFANGAQVVIDQFISSAEQKWGRLSGLVMLLPHGYEGQGPEHSSARLERYLQLCAQHNMQVCVPSTPAQMFHLLRRQMLRPTRKPLIVMTPKSLLRHKLAVSYLDDLTDGYFRLIIPEVDDIEIEKVRKVILCSGKVYYDLLQARRDKGIQDITIHRVEQLYPFPEAELAEFLVRYKQAKQVVWCQEEPKNQGAWFCSNHHLQACLAKWQKLEYAGRPFSASPAVGNVHLHNEQQKQLVEDALQ